MTASEWLACAEPHKILDYLRATGNESGRKLRYFSAACARRVWHLLVDERSRQAVEGAELFVDGLVSEAAVVDAQEAAANAWRAAEAAACAEGASVAEWRAESAAFAALGVIDYLPHLVPDRRTIESYVAAAEAAAGPEVEVPPSLAARPDGVAVENRAQADLLRCIMGNPFRPVGISPASRTPTVATVARAAYDDRILPIGHLDPARLAVLSDALEEAGCTDAALLAHLRSPGPHVRGCWVVDLILGKD